jgi:hypothetical protein
MFHLSLMSLSADDPTILRSSRPSVTRDEIVPGPSDYSRAFVSPVTPQKEGQLCRNLRLAP